MGDLPKRLKLKKTCLGCHFLVKTNTNTPIGTHTLSWADIERDGSWVDESVPYAMFGDGEGYRPECYKKRWTIPNHPDHEELLDRELNKDRERCFYFFEYRSEMELEAASDELQKQTESRKLKINFVLKIIGIIVTLGSVLTKLFGMW